MSKEVKKKEVTPELKSGATAHSDSNFEGQEHQSLRKGLQNKLVEIPEEAKENASVHQAAKDRRFTTTGEPSKAPCYVEDAE
jgi:hypothetical protein